jgi:hypothetical protein
MASAEQDEESQPQDEHFFPIDFLPVRFVPMLYNYASSRISNLFCKRNKVQSAESCNSTAIPLLH